MLALIGGFVYLVMMGHPAAASTLLLLSKSSEHLPVNIGNPVEWTIKDCATEVLAVTGSRSRVRYEPLPVDDPMQRCPDITKARTLLGWEPKISLRQGLTLSLDYFRASLPMRHT
jgi:dTDP-glucose 4,6-dehydratase